MQTNKQHNREKGVHKPATRLAWEILVTYVIQATGSKSSISTQPSKANLNYSTVTATNLGHLIQKNNAIQSIAKHQALLLKKQNM
jgi:hypothetical protein